MFYDEFQAFDLQTNANTGVGYRFVHEPELDFIGRLGGGTSREIRRAGRPLGAGIAVRF